MTDGRLAWIIIVAILLIDQIIKIEVKTTMCLGESIRLTDWFYINFIENNGYETYGVVVTGPKNEIESLEKLNMVRFLKVGEVKLWNWVR